MHSRRGRYELEEQAGERRMAGPGRRAIECVESKVSLELQKARLVCRK